MLKRTAILVSWPFALRKSAMERSEQFCVTVKVPFPTYGRITERSSKHEKKAFSSV